MQDDRLITAVTTCSDADDAFLDERRNRIYVSCGEGFLDVLAAQGASYVSLGRIPTTPGARTALFVPDIDRLVLAVRAEGTIPAATWVFRPTS
jgi:hypothetical protein